MASTIAFRIGLALRDRAIAASQLSSLSHEALKLVTDRNEEKGDKDAYHAALEAKAKWLEGRMTPEQLNLLTQKVETLLQKQT